MFEERATTEDMWDLATTYMPWFAVECHYTPDEVFDMPWPCLVQLTFVADRQAEDAKKTRRDIETRQRPMRPMA